MVVDHMVTTTAQTGHLMITQRSELITDQPYYESKSQQYFWTPDGIGCYWFESKKACLDDVDSTNLIIHIEELADF